jgi:hypothetical protein
MIEPVTSVSSPSAKATNPSNQCYRFLGELPTGPEPALDGMNCGS